MSDLSTHFRRIIVPVDFSPASDEHIAAGHALKVGNQHIEVAPASAKSIELGAALARAAGNQAKMRMVHATPTLDYSTMYTGPAGVALPAEIIEEILENARKTSIEALEALAGHHCRDIAVEYAARPGVPINVILEEARSFQADLIVLAASGRSRVTRFFVGSTADRVIRQAGCPVLVIPAEGTVGTTHSP